LKRGLTLRATSSPRESKTLARVPTNTSKNEDILQILAKSNTKKESLSIPIEFPASPPDPGEYVKTQQSTEEEYKEYMRKKLNQQNWENALIVYHRKEKDRDFTGMAVIIYRLVADSDTPLNHFWILSDIPVGFPTYSYPLDVDHLSNVDEIKQLKTTRKMWEISLQIYRRKVEEGDSKACVEIVGQVQNELIAVQQHFPKYANTDLSSPADDDLDFQLDNLGFDAPVSSPKYNTTTSKTTIPVPSTTTPRTTTPAPLPATTKPVAKFAPVRESVKIQVDEDIGTIDFPDFGDLPDLTNQLNLNSNDSVDDDFDLW